MMMFGAKLHKPTEDHHPQRSGGETARAATPAVISSSRKKLCSPIARGKTHQWQLLNDVSWRMLGL